MSKVSIVLRFLFHNEYFQFNFKYDEIINKVESKLKIQKMFILNLKYVNVDNLKYSIGSRSESTDLNEKGENNCWVEIDEILYDYMVAYKIIKLKSFD